MTPTEIELLLLTAPPETIVANHPDIPPEVRGYAAVLAGNPNTAAVAQKWLPMVLRAESNTDLFYARLGYCAWLLDRRTFAVEFEAAFLAADPALLPVSCREQS